MGGAQTKSVDELEDLAGVIIGHISSPEFDDIFEKAREGGMHTEEINNIYAALHLVSESIAIEYVKDLTGGEIELDYQSNVNIASSLIEGSQGKGGSYSYLVDQFVPGLRGASDVDVDVSITFSFPTRNPFFSFNEGSVGVTLQNMQVYITQFKAVSKSVTLSVEATNPVVIMNLGAKIFNESDGYFTSASIWSDDEVIESNIHQTIVDGDIVIEVDRVGTVSDLSGDLFFEGGDIENSNVNFDVGSFKMKMTLDGVSDDY